MRSRRGRARSSRTISAAASISRRPPTIIATTPDFADGGGAVLLISSDLHELLAICGRLLIISGGKIRETNPGERDPERLGLMMAGARD